jgi:hypothetical protein
MRRPKVACSPTSPTHPRREVRRSSSLVQDGALLDVLVLRPCEETVVVLKADGIHCVADRSRFGIPAAPL